MAYPSNLVFAQLAADNFQRLNENPLSQGGKWSIPDAASIGDVPLTALQIVSNQCVQTTPVSAETYTGISWPTDQWAECVLGSSAGASILLRSNVVDDTLQCYNVAVDGAAGTLSVVGLVSKGGSDLAIIDEFGFTFNPGDVIRAVVMGQGANIAISVYQNENLIGSVIDFHFFFASGDAGLAGPNTTLEIMSVTNFRGGFVTVATPPSSGFSPNWYEGQQNAGLQVYISPGQWGGVNYNGQLVPVLANSTSYLYLISGSGVVQVGTSLPSGAYGIAIVVSGQVQTSGNGPASIGMEVTSNGILSITDIRT